MLRPPPMDSWSFTLKFIFYGIAAIMMAYMLGSILGRLFS